LALVTEVQSEEEVFPTLEVEWASCPNPTEGVECASCPNPTEGVECASCPNPSPKEVPPYSTSPRELREL
jgi:hypothetical protein